MAYVDISSDDYADAEHTLGKAPRPTGRLRWWKGFEDEQPILQSEWKSRDGLSRIWVKVPQLTEVPG